MDQTEKDKIMGDLEEDRMCLAIQDKLNIVLIHTDENHPMDFIDENGNYYEIKSRRTKYETYSTTMISANKIKFCKKDTTKRYIFFFTFSNGDYYYEYNPLDQFGFGLGGRIDRGRDERRQYCYIPIKLLKKLELLN
jgi:hypothetical protein